MPGTQSAAEMMDGGSNEFSRPLRVIRIPSRRENLLEKIDLEKLCQILEESNRDNIIIAFTNKKERREFCRKNRILRNKDMDESTIIDSFNSLVQDMRREKRAIKENRLDKLFIDEKSFKELYQKCELSWAIRHSLIVKVAEIFCK